MFAFLNLSWFKISFGYNACHPGKIMNRSKLSVFNVSKVNHEIDKAYPDLFFAILFEVEQFLRNG